MQDIEQRNYGTHDTHKLISSLSWRAPEHHHFERSSDWYWALFLIMAAFFIISIILKNFLLGVFVVIAGFTIALYGSKPPKHVDVHISGRGLSVDRRHYPFESIESFWIFYEPPELKEISFRSEKTFMPFIKVPLGDEDPVLVREHLMQFVPEEHHEESLIETLARLMRF